MTCIFSFLPPSLARIQLGPIYTRYSGAKCALSWTGMASRDLGSIRYDFIFMSCLDVSHMVVNTWLLLCNRVLPRLRGRVWVCLLRLRLGLDHLRRFYLTTADHIVSFPLSDRKVLHPYLLVDAMANLFSRRRRRISQICREN